MIERGKILSCYPSGSYEFRKVSEEISRIGKKLDRELKEGLVLAEPNPRLKGWLKRTRELENKTLEESASILTTLSESIDQFDEQMIARFRKQPATFSCSQSRRTGPDYFPNHNLTEIIMAVNESTSLIKKPSENFVVKHTGTGAAFLGKGKHSQISEGYVYTGEFGRDFFTALDNPASFVGGKKQVSRAGDIIMLEEKNPRLASEHSEIFFLGNEIVSKYLGTLYDLYASGPSV